MRVAAILLWLITVVAVAPAAAQPAAAPPADPPIVEIRVHGNYATPSVDIVLLSGLHVGDASSEAVLTAAQGRLEASGRFAAADVRRLLRSIDDPNDVMVMLLIEELPGASEGAPRPGWLRQAADGLQWLPVLRYDEGYGFTYGVRPAVSDLAGRDSRLSVPLTWGGERRAGVEVTRSFAGPVLSSISAGGDVRRAEHPAFDVVERRTGVRGRIERQFGANVRAGAAAVHERVRLGDERGDVTSYLADLTVDTRLDPTFPRNAVWGRAEIGRLDVATGIRRRHRADAHVAVGLVGGSALTLSAFQESADGPLPRYEQAMIGGGARLRGYRLGYRVGDNASGASASWAVPISSPLSVARTGLRVFADWAGVYAAGTSFRDAAYDRGVGVGWFAQATGFTTGVDVARGDGKWRVHFRLGTRF